MQIIFTGYGENEFGYRFYDPIEKNVVRGRDVNFMEDQTIDDIDKMKKTTPKEDSMLYYIDPF
ncbi:putative RNA-directed DNA polymerase [Lupinus albus]|uniref:Putative RNA-directed DNA polymerase n=1 Tax=Lupinus albus TaxID=3870 RepID=A0A6A4QB28_LUPAL|nr:putative RNA-directed DNA polymerase [Lupinus albus]